MNRGTRGNLGQRQSVARFRLGVGTAVNLVPHFHSFSGDDVALLIVLVFHESNTGGAHGIVLNGDHGTFYRSVGTVLVAGETPTEIHVANLLLRAATDAPHGDVTITVAATGLLLDLNQCLFRLSLGDLLKGGALYVALRGGHGFIGTDGHL